MTMISRQEAKAQGLKHYSTGKPCKHGHVSERLVSNGCCCQCDTELQQTPEARARQAEYCKANSEKIAAYQVEYAKANRAKKAEYRKANSEKIAAKNAAYHQANSEKLAVKKAAYQVEYRKANRHLCNALNAKRKAAKLQATPPWADLEAIKVLYEQAAFVTKVTGEVNHVDHIIPLQGKTVCGLHVHTNLQILTASDNIKKSNKLLQTYETPKTILYYEQLSDFADQPRKTKCTV